MAYMRAFSMPVALKNRLQSMGKLPKSGTAATRMQHKKCPLCNTIPAPQDSQHTLSPRYPMYTILSSPRQTARIRAKKRLGYALFRLLSTNLIGNFLVKYPLLKLFPLFSVQTHHMYFPGRSPVISSNRARTDRSPYDRYLTASAPSNRYRRGHYSAVRTKSQWLRISQCLK